MTVTQLDMSGATSRLSELDAHIQALRSLAIDALALGAFGGDQRLSP